MTKKKKLKATIRVRMEKTGESYQGAFRQLVPTETGVAIYHVVHANEGFEESAQTLFDLVKSAQQQWPGKRRVLFLDIEGHRNNAGGFDPDMVELMQDYLVGFLGHHLSEIVAPLFHVSASNAQDNDIPDTMSFGAASD